MKTIVEGVIILIFVIVAYLGGHYSRDAPVTREPNYIDVKIINIKETDTSWDGYGDRGYTVVEYPDGVRRIKSGVLGKVGDTFKVKE